MTTLAVVWLTNQPVDVEVRLNETSVHNDNLPPLKDPVITLTLDNETKVDTIHLLDGSTTFTNIPHRYINKNVRVQVSCQDFIDVDTTLTLTQSITLDIRRNPSVYGNVHFRLWDSEHETGVADVVVEIAGQTVISDKDGHVSLFVPLESQRHYYIVKSPLSFTNDTIHTPCGEDDVLLVR